MHLNSALDIHYRLVNGADYTIMPDPAVANGLGAVYLKTRKTIDIAHGRILKVPTGIQILQYPTFELNSNPPVTVGTIARCCAIPELEEEEGLSVLGPQLISSDRNGEIYVTLKNNGKAIYHAERGETIALLIFSMVPMIEFSAVTS